MARRNRSTGYRDRWISCNDRRLRIRGYYFPWGTKSIRYSRIRSVTVVELSAGRGRFRIWGTASPRYWASLDPARPHKSTALVLDLGRPVRPFITPDDPDAVLAAITSHAPVPVERGGPGPVV